MRIVDLDTLLTMPKGTLYQTCEGLDLGGLQTFEGTFGGGDFLVGEFLDEPVSGHDIDERIARMDAMAKDGASYPVEFDNIGRDAGCSMGKMFAVWEPDDVRGLIAQLQRVLPEAE
jgi:hypothetical protein